MKTSRLKEIIDIIEESEINILNIEEDEFKLYYEKNNPASTRMPVNNLKEKNTADIEEKDGTSAQDQSPQTTDPKSHEITSPMIGTFYIRPEPDAEPYVQVGSTVSEGDKVCVLEAMKLLNEVTADINGEIIEILVEDGEVIEFGQPLFKVSAGE